MKKIQSLPIILTLLVMILITACVEVSFLPVIVIQVGCLLIVIIYSIIIIFLIFKKNKSAVLIYNLEKNILEKTEKLKLANQNFEEILKVKTEEFEKQNLVLSMNKRIIMSHNTDLEKIIETTVKENSQNNVMILLNSRLATMGEMISSIGHQWKQNLYAISLYTEGLKNILKQKGILDTATAKEPLDKIDTSIIGMYNNLNDFSDFVKPEKDIEFLSLIDVVEETLNFMRDFITINSVEIIRDYKDHPSITGFSNELKQVIMNILKNAIDVFDEQMIKDRVVLISIHCDDKFNYINIKDNAGGIALDNPDGVFDKYFTSKDNGTGLGLYLSRIVIEQRFCGKIEVQNLEGGACFTISIPVFTEDTVL